MTHPQALPRATSSSTSPEPSRHRHRTDPPPDPVLPHTTLAARYRSLRPSNQRLLRFTTLSLLFLLVLGVGSVVGETRQARADESARQAHTMAREFLWARADLASTVITKAAVHLTAARLSFESADARLLSDEERLAFEETLTAAETQLRDARYAVATATREASIPAPASATAEQIRAATATLADWDLVTPDEIEVLHQSLADGVGSVTTAVEHWTAEQNRLAAERAATELVAQQAAAQEAAEAAEKAAAQSAAEVARQQAEVQAEVQAESAAAASPAAATAPAPQASVTPPAPQASAGHTEYVWTTGFQPELDACKGSVDMTASFGKAVIGEHWSCGGSSFPTAEGSIVTVTGALSGTFRVGPVVAVLNQRTNTTNDVPGGYDLLYQTCVGGDNSRMSFTALQRIG